MAEEVSVDENGLVGGFYCDDNTNSTNSPQTKNDNTPGIVYVKDSADPQIRIHK